MAKETTKTKVNNLGTKQYLYLSLIDAITEYIEDNNLEVGDKLPSERRFASEWEVSRSSVREALRELEGQGIIRVSAGKGSYVSAERDDQSITIRIAKKNFFEHFEVKTVLERYIIKQVVPKISKGKLDLLEKIALEMIQVIEDGSYPLELDHKFHHTILDCYANKEMTKIVKQMIQLFDDYNEQYFNKRKGNLIEELVDTIPLHLDMVYAMKKQDVKEVLKIYQEIIEKDIEAYSSIK